MLHGEVNEQKMLEFYEKLKSGEMIEYNKN